MRGKIAYVVADIEGSTGVWTKAHAQMGREWQEARVELTHDLNAVAQGLFQRGVQGVVVKDFHRTGYNLIPAYLDKRVRLVSGYYSGPAIGFGDLHGAHFALFVGLHASSGNKEGFLAHTLTSRIAEIVVNGKRVGEAELFATVLSRFKVPVAFFSGCPEACQEAKEKMPWVVTYSIPKHPEDYDDPKKRKDYIQSARNGLKDKIREIPEHPEGLPLFAMKPPFDCRIILQNEAEARRLNRWGFSREGEVIRFQSEDFLKFYETLLKIAYFSRWTYALRFVLLPLSRTLWKIQSAKHLIPTSQSAIGYFTV